MSIPDSEDMRVNIEVVYARSDRQQIVSLTVAAGTKVREALMRSGLPDEYPEIDATGCALGIFGQLVSDDRVVQEGERVEIYRALRLDPMEARRRLAAEGLSMGAAPENGN